MRSRFGLVLAVLLGVSGAASADPPLQRTDPQHLRPVPPGGYDLPLAPPVMRYPLPPQLVVIRADQEWRKAGKVEKKLSDACAARSFREVAPLRYRAIFKKDVLGVAFGHGLNLHDPDKLADRKMIYLFRNGDSTGCIVVAMNNEDLRVLEEQGAEVKR